MLSYDLNNPNRSLIKAFVTWKALILLIAVGSSVGPAYDTSSTLISPHTSSASSHEQPFDLATKLTRWDAIYFVEQARRGYVFEQEWAFGAGLPLLVAMVKNGLGAVGFEGTGSLESTIAICISHASHLLSVLILYGLGVKIWKNAKLAFVAALLHVLSPAGLFLSAPYAESTFACLSFIGYRMFLEGIERPCTIFGDVLVLYSGMVFGLATAFRSNGVLNGLPFALFAMTELAKLIKFPGVASFRRLVALGLGGSYIALGLFGPQALAYVVFCSELSVAELRPWCTNPLPSIYSFVQERYWGVGFLRYWTPGNIPLFLLAAPMLYIMMRSGLEMLADPSDGAEKIRSLGNMPSDTLVAVKAMAVCQIILTVSAITMYHVQIITRISSAYPIWYWWLARALGDGKTSKFGGGVVVFIVMYAAIQGALFASFLPPA